LFFEGEKIDAVIVGGGTVATRRALALVDAGAQVRVIAPDISPELVARQNEAGSRLSLDRSEYFGPDALLAATLVIAATSSREVNQRVAEDAGAAMIPVNVADAPEEGAFIFAAVHRVGPITIGVTTGNVPNAAGRIRDSIAQRIDSRYADAVTESSQLRRSLVANGKSNEWRDIASNLIDESFCESVEDGTFSAKVAQWR
jgi:siroheme synthase-like protein